MRKQNYPKCRYLFSSSVLISFFIFISYSSFSFAATSTPKKKVYKDQFFKDSCETKVCKPFRLYASIIGGGAWTRVGESQSFTEDSTVYTYNADTDTQSQWLWGASVGEELRFYPDWAVQIGIAYYQTQAFEGKGTVTQEVDVDTQNTFDYEYSVITRQYLLEVKFLGDMAFGVHPYAAVGVGASFNSFNDYDVTITSPVTTFSPQFPKYTNNSFSYSAAVGFDVDITNYARLGIGYRYAWLGSVESGDAEINNVNISHNLDQDHLNASEAILQLTLLI